MNAYPAARWLGLKFVFEFVDQEARQDAVPSASNEDTLVSQLAQTVNDQRTQDASYVSLERNRWSLAEGNNFRPYPDDVSGAQTGYVSQSPSTNSGRLTYCPYLEFTFSEPHSSIGFTVFFEPTSGVHADHFSVQTYDANDDLISEADVYADSAVAPVNLLSPNYSRVRFTFFSLSRPNTRLRIAEIMFGVIETFDADTVAEATLKYEADPIAEALPTKECVVRLDNSSQRFNLINPEGIYSYLQQPQAFFVSLGIGDSRDSVEYVPMGEFFFATASAEDSSLTAEITAYDWFYWLEKSTFKNTERGMWSLRSALQAILTDAGIEAELVIPEAKANMMIQRLSTDMTHREAIRQAVQAVCCTAYFDRDNRLVVTDLSTGATVDVLDDDNMKEPPKVRIESAVNTVVLTTSDQEQHVERVYTAANVSRGELPQVKSVTNHMVPPERGQAVADWLLARSQGRLTYSVRARGNPETKIGETVRIKDFFDVNRNAIVTMQQFKYDGGLSEDSEAIVNGT